MAIYQFSLELIPKKGLLINHGKIPDKLILTKDEEGYIESNANEYWKLSKIKSDEIIKEIDKLLHRADWGNSENSVNWKIETKEVDNDAWMLFDETTGIIQELSFRADLREKELNFLKDMVLLAERHEFLLANKKGFIINPNKEELKELIKTSNPYKFVSNPQKFLTDLASGEIQIE